MKNFKTEKGSVTIEATISLTTFMFAIVTILTIINICTAQAKMSIAINTTAKEISQYSYLYGLTGFNKSTSELAAAADGTKNDINTVIQNTNTAFNEIENLGQTGKNTDITDPKSITDAWSDAVGSADKLEGAESALEQKFQDIAKDPKQFIFGIAKLLASEGLEEAKSKLIAAPLSKVMVQSHLKSSKDGSTESFLKSLGVVPAANGKYIDGLNFGESTLFAYGSNEIKITVTYKVKVIALLPINKEFVFTQTAITQGWLGGDSTYAGAGKTSERFDENNTIWTKATINERASLIRHMALVDSEKEGYRKTTGLTDVQAYNQEKNEFLMIASMNPLYSASGEDPIKLDDIDDKSITDSIKLLCGKIGSTTDGLKTVTTSYKDDMGTTVKTVHNCTTSKDKIILVVPEDPGLKERVEAIIKAMNTSGVTIEVVASYGNGASGQAAKTTESE